METLFEFLEKKTNKKGTLNVFDIDDTLFRSESKVIIKKDGKIVREATFVLTSSEYNPIALKIIKLVTKTRPELEVEVELKN